MDAIIVCIQRELASVAYCAATLPSQNREVCSTFWERDAKNHANFLRVPVT